MAGMLSDCKPWNIVAEGYVEEIKPIFEKWANDSFHRVGVDKNHSVIDIACGPGTVSLLLADRVKNIEAFDFSESMIKQFYKEIDSRGIDNIQLNCCDCQKLPGEENRFDRAFSQFGLMFFPDRLKGFSEMYRVLKPGGVAAVYSWASIEESSAMKMMMGALNVGFSEMMNSESDEVKLEGLENEDVFRKEMQAAGFKDITMEKISHTFPVKSVDEFWKSQVIGSAPICMMKANLDKEKWELGEKRALEFLNENLLGDSLSSTAILGIGKK